METDDIYRAGSFIQRGSWTNNNADEAFSKSSRDEDDEEALKWAALEKLPTYSRLRKGLLTTSDGAAAEIDVDHLGFQQRKELMDRLVKVPQEDNEKFFLNLRDRIDRVGIQLPTTEVRFEHLNIEAEAHVGSRALTTFFNFFISVFEGLLSFLHILPNGKKQVSILKDVSGIIKPSQ
ncbi:Pleiotropic drug resistance protein 1 [Linum grandiflorum]